MPKPKPKPKAKPKPKGVLPQFGKRTGPAARFGKEGEPSRFSRAERLATKVREGSDRARRHAKRAEGAPSSGYAAGAAFAIGGKLSSTALAAAGISVIVGHIAQVGLIGLSKMEKRNFVLRVLGRRKLAGLVGNQMANEAEKAQVHALGTIFLSKKVIREMRKDLRKPGAFEFNTFWASISELRTLGKLNVEDPKLTPELVDMCLKGHNTKLEYPLKPATRNALRLAIRTIKLTDQLNIKPKTMRSIIEQVFALENVSLSDKDRIIVRLAKRFRDSRGKIFETDFLRGLNVTMRRKGDWTVKVTAVRER